MKMNKPERSCITSLAQFCIMQRKTFSAKEWIERSAIDGKAIIAFAAKYLSMTSWYGYDEELDRVAREINYFDETSAGLSSESQAIDFDLLYFSTSVRRGIAMSQAASFASSNDSPVGMADADASAVYNNIPPQGASKYD